MKKSEQSFIKKLEAYLNTEFNEYSKNRIIMYLEEYKAEIPPIIITKANKTEVVQEITESRRENYKYKELVTNDMLLKEAAELCGLHQMSSLDFFNTKKYKSSKEVVNVRKIFCQKIFENYLCNNNILAAFLGVDHSTITFYLYGKKYISKKQPKKV
jgi:hypothetical protein